MNLTSIDGPKLAAIAAKVGRDAHQVKLDYTVGSLVELDTLIDRIAARSGDTESNQNSLFIFGCYLGEVFVRNAGGEWRATAGTPMEGNTPYPLVVWMKESGAVCNPIGKAFKRFENGPEDALPAFYEAVAAWRP